MHSKFLYGASVLFGTAALLLLIINITMINSNRALQVQVNGRAASINNGTNASQVNQALVQALADAVVKNSNADIKELLTSQGITIKPNEKATEADSATKDSKKK